MKGHIGHQIYRSRLAWIVFASLSYLAVTGIAQKSTAASKPALTSSRQSQGYCHLKANQV